LRKSLVGQSEVLVICGTVLLLNSAAAWGSIMIVAGLLGAVTRFAIDFQLLHEEKEQGIDHAYEKAFTRVLSETARS